MGRIQNLKIVKEIFDEKLPDKKFSLIDYFIYSSDYNMRTHYIGQRKRNNNEPVQNSLFAHEDIDYYYYDVLDKDKQYIRVYTEWVYSDKSCNKMENLKELVKEKKKG